MTATNPPPLVPDSAPADPEDPSSPVNPDPPDPIKPATTPRPEKEEVK